MLFELFGFLFGLKLIELLFGNIILCLLLLLKLGVEILFGEFDELFIILLLILFLELFWFMLGF